MTCILCQFNGASATGIRRAHQVSCSKPSSTSIALPAWSSTLKSALPSSNARPSPRAFTNASLRLHSLRNTFCRSAAGVVRSAKRLGTKLTFAACAQHLLNLSAGELTSEQLHVFMHGRRLGGTLATQLARRCDIHTAHTEGLRGEHHKVGIEREPGGHLRLELQAIHREVAVASRGEEESKPNLAEASSPLRQSHDLRLPADGRVLK